MYRASDPSEFMTGEIACVEGGAAPHLSAVQPFISSPNGTWTKSGPTLITPPR